MPVDHPSYDDMLWSLELQYQASDFSQPRSSDEECVNRLCEIVKMLANDVQVLKRQVQKLERHVH